MSDNASQNVVADSLVWITKIKNREIDVHPIARGSFEAGLR